MAHRWRFLAGRAVGLLGHVKPMPGHSDTAWALAMITFLRIVRRARDFLVKFADPAVTDVEHGPWPHLFHFSLRARCTAMLAGLRTLIQTGHGPDLDRCRL